LEKDTIIAGDSAALEVIFATKTYAHQVKKTPRIYSNSDTLKNARQQSKSWVAIEADVTPRPDSTHPVVIKPYKIDISQFSEKPRDEVTFTIENVSDKPVGLTLIAVPNQFVEVDLPKEIEPGKTAEGTLRVKPDAADKEFEKSFTFEVNDENHTRFTVPIKRMVRVQGHL
jgi:hypothetical protein